MSILECVTRTTRTTRTTTRTTRTTRTTTTFQLVDRDAHLKISKTWPYLGWDDSDDVLQSHERTRWMPHLTPLRRTRTGRLIKCLPVHHALRSIVGTPTVQYF